MNWIQGLLIASIFALLVYLVRSRRSVQSQAWVKVGSLNELPLSVTARKIARMLTAS